jgi:hypothetical protein
MAAFAEHVPRCSFLNDMVFNSRASKKAVLQ